MARKGGRAGERKRRQPERRRTISRSLKRMGAWLPVAVVGVGAVGIVVLLILVSRGTGSDNSKVDIPGRTVSTEGRTLGSADARVTVEEYSDFQCPYCARAAATIVPQIEQQYVADGRVKIVYHPVALIGQESTWAAEAAECANEQGKFWEYHDKLFESQQGENQGAFAIDNLKGFAQEIGLDTQAFNQCIDSGKYENLVKAETKDALDKGLTSTPTFVVGDQNIVGPRSFQDVQNAIEAELRKNP
jgi:protein-disulfide isomerase